MPIKCQEINSSEKWDEAIADAKEKIRKLRFSIRVFEARKASGDTFPPTPVTQLTRRSRRQQHSV